MPSRSKEEREQRKVELRQKQEARRLKREQKAAAAKAAQDASCKTKNQSNAKGAPSNSGPSLLLEMLPEDAMQQVFCCLPARELGAFLLTCRSINDMLPNARIPFIMSRLCRELIPTRGGVGFINMCRDEAEARDILKQSYSGGDTGRLVVTKRKSKSLASYDEFVGYARFLQEGVSGYSPTSFGGRNTVMLPPVVNGRFASTSPEHSLCRVGGDGAKSGPGGSGVASWGVGKRGQLGHGKRQDQVAPKRLLGGIGYGIRIVQVSAGGGLVRVAHSLLLTSTGRVLSFGTAQYGQLGHGYSSGKQLSDEMRPRYVDSLAHLRCTCVSAGELHSAVTTEDGDVYTWGDGFCGQLGLGDKRPQLLPQQVAKGGLEDECVASVTCGNRHTLCVTEEGQVFSFGLGHFGVLGRNFTPFEYDADAAVVALGAGVPLPADAENGLAVEEEPPAAAVPPAAAAPSNEQEGENNNNETENATSGIEGGGGMSAETLAHLDLLANLSLDDSSNQCIPMLIDSLDDINIVGASAGHRHSILLDDKGGLYTCGSGVSGALGHGDYISQSYPMKVMEFVDQDIKILNMSAGVDMSMAVTTTGEVYAWGKSDGGRIGLGVNSGNVSIPRRVIVESPGGGETVKAVDVECGYVHSIVVGLSGTIYQCGGVGTHGEADGQTDGDGDGRPQQVEDFNIWHRIPEPKKETVKKEKWQKYGKYELRGRSQMMSEAERWNT